MPVRPHSLITLLVSVILSAFVAWNCAHREQVPAAPPSWDAGNKKMAEILKQHAEHADFLASGSIIINDRAVAQYREQLKHIDSTDTYRYLGIRTSLAAELLRSGHPEEAIAEFRAIMSGRDSTMPMYRQMKSMLAACYFRLGEVKNCIDMHNAERCIFPIRGRGVYTIQEPTRMAIAIYKELLRDDPKDYQSRWLMNIAYQALGIYPDSVPRQYFIAADHFDSPSTIGRFNDVAPNVGLDITNLAGGVVMEDFNNDGNLDLFMTSESFTGVPTLMMNDGKGGFIDRTKEAGLEGEVAGRVMATADYDNDGFVDIFVCRGAWLRQEDNHWPCSLLHNNGDGTFSDVTEAAGLLAYSPTSSAAWGDYDNDGFVDLFVAHETKEAAHPHPSTLYHNNGNGTFTEVTIPAGITISGYCKAASWGDFNNDGWIDLYVSNLTGSNFLYKNNGRGPDGKVTFTDVTKQAGVEGSGQTFPAFFCDFNNDGWPDLFSCTFDQERTANYLPMEYLGIPADPASHPRLYLNNHDGTFTDIAQKAHLGRLIFAMSMGFGDIDNDGFQDFYCGTGFLDLRFLFPNLMFRNNGGTDFQDVTRATGTGHLQKGHGIAFGDINNDGQQDVFSMMGGGYSGDAFTDVLYLNPGNKNHWINLKLEGKKSNRAALGTRIKVTTITAHGEQEIYTTVGYDATFGAGSLQQEIGLGQAKKIKSIEVTWPASGIHQVLTDVAMDQFYHVQESEGNSGLTPYPRTKVTFNTTAVAEHKMNMKMP